MQMVVVSVVFDEKEVDRSLDPPFACFHAAYVAVSEAFAILSLELKGC